MTTYERFDSCLGKVTGSCQDGTFLTLIKVNIVPLACSLYIVLRILLLGVVVLGVILGGALLAEGCRSFIEFLLGNNGIQSLSIERFVLSVEKLTHPWR